MPVEKFRSVEAMPRPVRVDDAGLIEHIRRLWNLAFALSPPSFARGVTRFTSIESANEARAEATRQRMRRVATASSPGARSPKSQAVFSVVGARIRDVVRRVVGKVTARLREACRPALAVGFARDLFRTREQLMVENAMLRHQLIVASRTMKRPAFRPLERCLLVALSSWPRTGAMPCS